MSDVRLIAGRYQLLDEVGSGGMGVLYRAVDRRVGGREVAIKLLKEEHESEEARRRFEQEATAAGRLAHDNIVRIFDAGSQDGRPYIVMELVDGENLAQIVRRGVPLSLSRRLDIVQQVCDGLAYAHAQGIVHRDVKPANVMLARRDGRVKILDFGIAKVSASSLTLTGAMLGSLPYMSPEQLWHASTVDHRSDIYTVGLLLFELLTGQRAFKGGVEDGLLARLQTPRFDGLGELVPDLDPAIEDAFRRATAIIPDDRFETLQELSQVLGVARARMSADLARCRREAARLLAAGRGHLARGQAAVAHEFARAALDADPDSEPARELKRACDLVPVEHGQPAEKRSGSGPRPAAAVPPRREPGIDAPRSRRRAAAVSLGLVLAMAAGWGGWSVREQQAQATDQVAAAVPAPQRGPDVSAAPPAPVSVGAVFLDAAPWAFIERVEADAEPGRNLIEPQATPMRAELAAGTYRVSMRAGDGARRSASFAVRAGHVVDVRIGFTAETAEQYFDRLGM